MADEAKHPIRLWREERKLSLEALSETLGVSKMALSRWERGVALPRTKDWPRIAVVTGVTPAQLAEFKASVTA